MNRIKDALGNSHHRWMWDVQSLSEELRQAGFSQVRPCAFRDSSDPMFERVEEESRFWGAVALEARK